MNAVQVLFRIVDRPAEALRGAVERPRTWWLPAILLALGLLVVSWFSAPYGIVQANERTQEMIDRITAQMPAETATAVRQTAAEMTVPRYLLTAVGLGVVTAALGWVLRGALAHFLSMMGGGTSTWGPTFAACVWSMLPFFVRDMLITGYVLVFSGIPEHAGLSFLVQSGDWLADSRNLCYVILSNTDPFALWHIVLLAVALHVATRLGKGGSFFLALGIWALFLGLKLIPVVVGSALGSPFMG
ncbi:MAG: hypothetical protein FJZ90_07850 [Chloroflexi bacterium]|nr:hypothetical protein [Chloroflexota bacterium]